MTSKPKVCILGYNQYITLFTKRGWKLELNPRKADLVCFTGGTDIDATLYNRTKHHNSGYPDVVRDKKEVRIFNDCLEIDIPMIGICRGAQLLCVLSGGSLVQHVKGHNSYHRMQTPLGEFLVPSSHHQMMYPWDTDHMLLGYAIEQSTTYQVMDEDGKMDILLPHEFQIDEKGKILEPEVVMFPSTNALGHQPHPEWMANESPYTDYFFQTIETHLGIS